MKLNVRLKKKNTHKSAPKKKIIVDLLSFTIEKDSECSTYKDLTENLLKAQEKASTDQPNDERISEKTKKLIKVKFSLKILMFRGEIRSRSYKKANREARRSMRDDLKKFKRRRSYQKE